jgi:two-component system, LytTR family, response regulator
MNTIRALVVDDEKPGRERVRRLLTRDARVDLAACCAGGAEAIEAVRVAEEAGNPVQVMFLDVQMPEIDGFAVIKSLVQHVRSEKLPAVVFVTAHDEYALRAFDAHAVDYLLKPFSDERFQAALDRAIRHVKAGHAEALVAQMQALLDSVNAKDLSDSLTSTGSRSKPALDRIVLRGSNRVRLLPVDQISWIEADGMYVKLHTRDGGVHLHRGLLGSFDSALDERCFVRIHRSAIVNIDVVNELRQNAHGDYIAVLRDRTEVRVGRRFRARLQARLGQAL